MYSRIVKIIPVTSQGEDEEDIQYGILDEKRNVIMSGFNTYEEAEDELRYQKEEVKKIGDFGGDA
ncbi:hypothetical protein BBF96_13630 [Anoxybacter fermentans]|uniref:Uncharacterized protein n=1 Tax=Anoxybacter fermentans TaxID=1323375 RepID=A0A3Q9HS67_9FIRM|nr:hypothetical protein [Anoxybacter fermentans]AZR74339.1 hypothetical protein BBF96_13630 [Anoxybacter fermentans]